MGYFFLSKAEIQLSFKEHSWEYSYNCITNQRWVFIYNKSIFNRRLKSKCLDCGVPKVKPTDFIVSKEIKWHLISNKTWEHFSPAVYYKICWKKLFRQEQKKILNRNVKLQKGIQYSSNGQYVRKSKEHVSF